MSKFKPNDLHVKAGGPKLNDVRVMKDFSAQGVPGQTNLTGVQDFQYAKLKNSTEGHKLNKLRKKLGEDSPLGAPTGVAQRDRRFSLHELVRNTLSVEEEEQQKIEEQVNARLAKVESEAKDRAATLGYEEGLRQGYEEAFKKFQQEGQARLQRLDAFLASVENAKRDIFQANEKFLMEMIFRISKMVMLRELQADRAYLLRLARELIERVGVRENITIQIHPEDQESIAMLKEGLETAMGGLKNLNIEVSSAVDRGGCTVETEWNMIDASIETQLAAVHDALIGGDAK